MCQLYLALATTAQQDEFNFSGILVDSSGQVLNYPTTLFLTYIRGVVAGRHYVVLCGRPFLNMLTQMGRELP